MNIPIVLTMREGFIHQGFPHKYRDVGARGRPKPLNQGFRADGKDCSGFSILEKKGTRALLLCL